MVLTDRIGGRLVIESQRVFDRIFCEAERFRPRLIWLNTCVLLGIQESWQAYLKIRCNSASLERSISLPKFITHNTTC